VGIQTYKGLLPENCYTQSRRHGGGLSRGYPPPNEVPSPHGITGEQLHKGNSEQSSNADVVQKSYIESRVSQNLV